MAGEPLAFQPLISKERNRSLTSSSGMALATTHGRQVKGKESMLGAGLSLGRTRTQQPLTAQSRRLRADRGLACLLGCGREWEAIFNGSQNLCSAHCCIYKYDKQVVTELQYKVMYYMQILKDLVLGLK